MQPNAQTTIGMGEESLRKAMVYLISCALRGKSELRSSTDYDLITS